MAKLLACSAVAGTALLLSCASEPIEDALLPGAVKVALERGASELACPSPTAEVLSKLAISEGRATDSHEAPQRAEYKVLVSGCGNRTTYLVACKKAHSVCEAGPAPAAAGSGALAQLAHELRPDALKAAQQRGSKDFACPSMTGEVTREETIVETQNTSSDAEAPHRALYAATVEGCGKQTTYLVECDREKHVCATGGLQQTQAQPQQVRLTDELQPGAVRVATERGSKQLDCPGASAEVRQTDTIEEGQPGGWYEPPFRALYAIAVSGCGKQSTYLVICDKKQDRCAAGSPGGN